MWQNTVIGHSHVNHYADWHDDACCTGSAHCLRKQTGSEDIQLMPFAPCKIRLTFLNLIFRSVNDIFQCHSLHVIIEFDARIYALSQILCIDISPDNIAFDDAVGTHAVD